MADPLPYMRWFVGAFSSDTGHLSPAQLGHHVRLLMLAWRRASCSIPDDTEWISRRLGVGPEDYERDVAPMLADLWESDGEDLSNAEQRAERSHAEEKSRKGRHAASIRYCGTNVHPLKAKEK